jgi:hypothetical protein
MHVPQHSMWYVLKKQRQPNGSLKKQFSHMLSGVCARPWAWGSRKKKDLELEVLARLKLALAKPVTYPTPTQLRRLQLGLAFGNPKFLVIANFMYYKGPVHSAYNLYFSACFFQPEQCFSLTTNRPTVFFSRLISTAERGQNCYPILV